MLFHIRSFVRKMLFDDDYIRQSTFYEKIVVMAGNNQIPLVVNGGR